MGDFYLPSNARTADCLASVGGRFDWERLLSQVLEPLARGRDASFQVYDWNVDALAQWVELKAGRTIIIEGIYTLRKELCDYYDFRVYVHSSRSTRLARGLEREGEEARARGWTNGCPPRTSISNRIVRWTTRSSWWTVLPQPEKGDSTASAVPGRS